MKLTIKKLYELIEESINNTKQSPSDAIKKIFSNSLVQESKEPISPDHMEKLKMLLNSSIQDGSLAIELMKSLGMSEEEIYNMIHNMLPQITDVSLQQFYKQQINMYLAKEGGLDDL